MQMFYSTLIQENAVILPADESWHCAKVLRMNAGEEIRITDGQGHLYICRLTDTSSKQCVARIIETLTEEKREWKLHIAISPTKNIDRFEWFAEKATEIGIDEITPLYTAHSERTRLKPERIQRILISAMKQSLKYTLPVLHEEKKFSDLLKTATEPSRFLAYCETGSEAALSSQYKKGSDVIILIGPEGDFSPLEAEEALKAGFVHASLGKSRLRTETAGIVACHSIHLLNNL